MTSFHCNKDVVVMVCLSGNALAPINKLLYARPG